MRELELAVLSKARRVVVHDSLSIAKGLQQGVDLRWGEKMIACLFSFFQHTHTHTHTHTNTHTHTLSHTHTHTQQTHTYLQNPLLQRLARVARMAQADDVLDHVLGRFGLACATLTTLFLFSFFG